MTKQPQKGAPSSTDDPALHPYETFLDGLPAWQVAALKAHTNWPAGRAVTRAQFDDALKAMKGEVIK